MTATFWWIVTSELTQAAAGVLALAAAAVALLGRWWPGLAAYAAAARLISYIAIFVVGLGVGFRSADETAALRQAQTDLAFTRLQFEAQRQTADVAAKLRAAAQADADAANAKVTDYETWLESRDQNCGCAFDADDVRRLQDIGR